MRLNCASGHRTARRDSDFSLFQSGERQSGRRHGQPTLLCCARARSSTRAALIHYLGGMMCDGGLRPASLLEPTQADRLLD
jgi:hypothetical protein